MQAVQLNGSGQAEEHRDRPGPDAERGGEEARGHPDAVRVLSVVWMIKIIRCVLIQH